MRHLKKGGAYFKENKIICMKFQKSVFVSFQISMSN